MDVKLVLAAEVEQDLDDAYSWYEFQRIGLGEEFLSCIDACFQSICRMPEIHAFVREPFRRVLVRRFPYAVYYEFAAQRVIVHVVIHTARDPQRWQVRLSEE